MIDQEATTAYANIHLVTMPDAIPTHPCSELSHPRRLSINTAGYTRHIGRQLDHCTVGLQGDVRVSSFQEERSMPTLIFCLLFVNKIELVITRSDLSDMI